MYIKRKDKGCESRVLAVTPGKKYGVLIEARWDKNQRNIVNVSEEYFREKYGREAKDCLR
jgi:Ni,Fe-hydrogenase III component G